MTPTIEPIRDPAPRPHPRRASGCIAACPVKDDGAPCLKTCVLNQGHSGSHRCPDGHSWR